MAPKESFDGTSATPAFLARVMALPAFNEALTLASQVYDSTKRNELMGAAILASEASIRVAATGAIPLAAPILERVGGWEKVDEWACRGLDSVERVAPIIKQPTQEIVKTTRQRVLGAVAGDHVIVPDTLNEAIIARANSVVEALTERMGVRAVTEGMERVLDTAHALVNTHLPPLQGDQQHSDLAGAGVTGRSMILVRKIGHRLYSRVFRTLQPGLPYHPDAVITLNMMVDFGRVTLMNSYKELVRESRPGEEVGLAMDLTRKSARLTLDTFTRLNALLKDISLRKLLQDASANFPTDTQTLVERVRSVYTYILTRLTPAIQASVDRLRSVYTDVLTRLTPAIQASVDRLRSMYTDAIAGLTPLLQTSIDRVRSVSRDTFDRLFPIIQASAERLRIAYTDTVSRLPPEVQAPIERLVSTLKNAIQRIPPTIEASVNSVSGMYVAVVARITPIIQETLKTTGEIAMDPVTRLPPALQQLQLIIRTTTSDAVARLGPMIQAGFDAFRRSLNEERAREIAAVILDYGKYVFEEARLWSKVALVLVQLTPTIAIRISQTTRVFAAEWLRRVITSLEVSTKPPPHLYRKGFVPVKVTMMAHRDAL
ncbi:hypothetical protein OTU49_015047 [Cherax quadricarinatus]|uniref:Uncharacterized protein n=1 Tax=Cherax quadricarinatus TaxID=27406 RepID=A0AAW0YGS1_CHEQU